MAFISVTLDTCQLAIVPCGPSEQSSARDIFKQVVMAFLRSALVCGTKRNWPSQEFGGMAIKRTKKIAWWEEDIIIGASVSVCEIIRVDLPACTASTWEKIRIIVVSSYGRDPMAVMTMTDTIFTKENVLKGNESYLKLRGKRLLVLFSDSKACAEVSAAGWCEYACKQDQLNQSPAIILKQHKFRVYALVLIMGIFLAAVTTWSVCAIVALSTCTCEIWHATVLNTRVDHICTYSRCSYYVLRSWHYDS